MSRLLGIILVGTLSLTAASVGTGCAEDVYVTANSPPAPQDEVVATRPGSIWVHGHWRRTNGDWRWTPGYFTPERPNQVFVEGRWERRGTGYVWITGNWRSRENVVSRDPGPMPPEIGEP